MSAARWQRYRFLPYIPLGNDGKRVTASKEHIAVSEEAAKEGMVLLKNENRLLPFEKGTRLALFGKGTFDYVRGGGGSGDVTVDYTMNLYEGLHSLESPVFTEPGLDDFYREYVSGQYRNGCEPGMMAEPALTDELLSKARSFTDTALISISRFSGEGWDRTTETQKTVMSEENELVRKASEIFEHGDFYLSEAEKTMVAAVTELFPKVAVVLNVGGIVDTEWFCNNDRIRSVLMGWQGGMEGGKAEAELLFGYGNPSGKLSDTFAKSLDDYPSSEGFHESEYYVDYTEDIYVGYRYFETIPGASEKVNYPFGFGLSYTKFRWNVVSACASEEKIIIEAKIVNTGSRPGKEVLQVYTEAPQGLLGKPGKVLSAYKKTRLLSPGEEQTVFLSFDISSMASYDDTGKVAKSAYVLEKGTYFFHVGTSVRDTVKIGFTYEEKESRVTEQLSQKLAPAQLGKRLLSDGTCETLPQFTRLAPMPAEFISREHPATRAVPRLERGFPDRDEVHNFEAVAEGTVSLHDFVSALSVEELMHLLGGQPNTGIANTYGFGNLPQYSVPSMMTADGPAGMRILPECGVTATAFPCATLLACTWDPEITFAAGECMGSEVRENNISSLLTPAVNIHRSPLCGRNFEYYSEDPFLAGTMAAGMVRGLQSQHVSASVKHFALNNKETNRRECDSRVSERAAREIYLKVFEIIVKTAKPWYIMSSYNIINGCRASENAELLTDILRGEWGFDGIVSSDWWTNGEHYKEVKAGNDIKMGCGFPERLQDAYEKGLITREELETSAERVLAYILRFE